MIATLIHHQLLTVLRQRRTWVLQAAVALALSALVLWLWPGDRLSTGRQVPAPLAVVGYGLMAALMLLIPAHPATEFVRRRRSGELALLLGLPLGPGRIVLSQLVGSLGLALVLLLASLPPAAACFTMGGIGLESRLLAMYLVLLLLAVQYAAVGLWVGSFAGAGESSLRLTYLAVLLLGLASIGPHHFTKGLRALPLLPNHLVSLPLDGPVGLLFDWLRCLSPITPMAAVMNHGPGPAAGFDPPGDLLARFALLSLALTGGLLGWTAWRLSAGLVEEPRPAGIITDQHPAAAGGWCRFRFLWFLDPQRRGGLIPDWMNPVLVTEFRQRHRGRLRWVVRAMAGCLVVGLVLVYGVTVSAAGRADQLQRAVAELAVVVVVLQLCMILLVAPRLSAGLIAGDRQSGHWDLLRLTGLSPASIVLGKLAGAAFHLGLLLAATLPACAVLLAAEPSLRGQAPAVLATLALTALWALLISAATGSCFRRTAPAVIAAYAVIGGWCALTGLIWLAREAPLPPLLVRTAVAANPLAAGLSLVGLPGWSEQPVLPAAWWFLAAGAAAGLALLLWRTWRLTRPA